MKSFSPEDSFLKKIPTPFFVLDIPALSKELSKVKNAIDECWSNTIIAYSVKTNSLPYLAKYLCSQGAYAEVVSQDEYEMVSLCGYPNDRIVCNGPMKSKDFVCALMDQQSIINIDSHREIDYAIEYAKENGNKRFTVGLRVNVDIEKYFPTESKGGEQGSRFGFCMENDELENAIEKIESCPNLAINGFHLHVSTSTRRVEIYRWLAHTFLSLVNKYSLKDVTYFDIGGGFYGGLPNKPQWKDYLSAIADELKKGGFSSEKLSLILEPGVSLLAGSFSYYTSVIDVKDTNRSRFVVTDGSRIHIDPFFHKTSYFYEHYRNEDKPISLHPKQIVVGFTCLEYDNIMVMENCEEIAVNDVFRFDKLGAYTLTLSPLFISYYPAVYTKNEDGTYQCVRERWTAKDFVQKSFI